MSLVSEVARALAGDDAESALADALGILATAGLVATEGPDGWLCLTHRGRALTLAATGSLPPPEVTDIVAHLLRAALARAVNEEDLQRTRERMEMLSAASFEGILVHIDGVVIDANQRLSELLGYTHDELMGRETLPRSVAAEDLQDVFARMASKFEGEYVITGVRKDGSRFRAELASKQGRLGQRPVRVVAVRDVTERERTHALLRESEARLRELAEASFDLFVMSREGIIVEVGGPLQRILGYSPEQIVGRRVLDFVAPAALPLTSEIIAEKRVGTYESTLVDADDNLIPFEIVGVNSTLNGEPIRLAGLRDLRPMRRLQNERRQLEQQIERSQRLDSLGVLAGGIAHDFNNLLTGVLGNAEFLAARVTDPTAREAVDAIRVAGQRAATLTSKMLAYAGQKYRWRLQPVELGAMLDELRTLLAATLSKKAQVEFIVEPNSVVLADRASLTQVLMNLLTNASDALGGRPGRIDVRCRPVRDVDARWDAAQGAVVGPGNWVLIEVRDTGDGMSDATRGRIFEPFFSTKEKGHGLGLAACVGIVRSHDGAILVESEPGQGSCFSVLLPRTQLEGEIPTDTESAPRIDHACRVLVIDDEALVRSHVSRALLLRGHTVLEANSGTAGIAAIETERPDVVVLDMTMPDLDGADVVRRVRAGGSRVPIVISSGYLDADVERRLEPGAFQAFLSKPYSLAELIDAIERARTSGH